MSEPNTRRRLVVIGLIVVALFAGLLTRLWFLQVAGGEDLAVAAQQNGDKIVQIPAIRGRILDAKGRVLAETMPVTSLVVDRQALTEATRPKLVANLATLLADTPDNINKEIDNPNYPAFQPIPILQGVSNEIATALVEHASDYPEASLESSYVRVYPRLTSRAHVVGYVGRINPEEYAARQGRRLRQRRHHRQGRRREAVRVGAARHARARAGAGQQPRPRDRIAGDPQGGAGPRRAVDHRHRRAADRRAVAAAGHRRRSEQRQARERGCRRRARRAVRCGRRAGVEPHVRPEPTRRRHRARRVVRQERVAPALRPRAQRLRARLHVQDDHRGRAALGDDSRAQRHRDVLRQRLLQVRERRGAVQREEGRERLRRPRARDHGVERRVLLQRRQRVLEALLQPSSRRRERHQGAGQHAVARPRG